MGTAVSVGQKTLRVPCASAHGPKGTEDRCVVLCWSEFVLPLT